MDILPPELLWMVFDHLNFDKATLNSCTLVCQSWLPGSRCRLFRSIQVLVFQNGGQLTTFISFLEDNPIICGYIRTLCLYGSPIHLSVKHTREDLAFPIDVVEPSISPCTIGNVLTAIPHLQELTIRQLKPVRDSQPLLPSLRARFQLKRLQLVLTSNLYDLIPIMDVFQFFNLFSELGHVKLEAAAMDFTSPAPTKIQEAYFPPTQSLELSGIALSIFTTHFFPVLSRASNHPRSLSIDHQLYQTGHFDPLFDYLSCKGSTISLLRLAIPEMYNESASTFERLATAIKSCTRLHTLVIFGTITISASGHPLDAILNAGRSPWLPLAILLSNISSTVERIVIATRLACNSKKLCMEELGKVDWSAVSYNLRQLSNLKAFQLKIIRVLDTSLTEDHSQLRIPKSTREVFCESAESVAAFLQHHLRECHLQLFIEDPYPV